MRTYEPNPGPAPAEADSFPPGLPNAFWFAGFNALSFQIILAAPMIIYAKTLGASATILGVIVGMMPLLVVFQIPAAHYVNRVGASNTTRGTPFLFPTSLRFFVGSSG